MPMGIPLASRLSPEQNRELQKKMEEVCRWIRGTGALKPNEDPHFSDPVFYRSNRKPIPLSTPTKEWFSIENIQKIGYRIHPDTLLSIHTTIFAFETIGDLIQESGRSLTQKIHFSDKKLGYVQELLARAGHELARE